MYTKTLAKTIAEAIDKLLDIVGDDYVFNCPIEALTDAQRELATNELYKLEYFEEDYNLAKSHIFVNLTNDHIYMLEMTDDEDDEVAFYFVDLVTRKEVKPNDCN